MKKLKKENRELEKVKTKIIKILKDYKIKKAGIFGSYATGTQRKGSDIDILIDVNRIKFSLFDLAGLEIKLKKKLKKKVDLVTYTGISPYLRKRILKQEIRIL